MRARIRALERALVLERTEIALAKALEELKDRWELAASTGGPEPSSFDLSDALRDTRVPGISALPYALRYVDNHARDEGGPDCAQIFKILMRGSPVPAYLERPKPKSKKTPTPGRDDDVL